MMDLEDRTDAIFAALADRTRRDILRRVLTSEHSVSELAAHYPMSFAAVQKHVSVLERSGLVSKRRQGKRALASGQIRAIRSAGELLGEMEQVWRGHVSRVDALLAADPAVDSAADAILDSEPSTSHNTAPSPNALPS